MLHRFANPKRFMRLSGLLLPWMAGLAIALVAAGLFMGLIVAPADYQQGDSARIMYVHVPNAWMAMFCYTAMAAASAVSLIWKHPLADLAAKSSAPIGAAFTFLALFTGSLWGKPMWGTWWVWDARLTSMLVLLFLYFGIIALGQSISNRDSSAKACAVLAIVGVINIPIIKYSVEWWNSLHQVATFKLTERPAHPP